jgi:hypothetical protein
MVGQVIEVREYDPASDVTWQQYSTQVDTLISVRSAAGSSQPGSRCQQAEGHSLAIIRRATNSHGHIHLGPGYDLA